MLIIIIIIIIILSCQCIATTLQFAHNSVGQVACQCIPAYTCITLINLLDGVHAGPGGIIMSII